MAIHKLDTKAAITFVFTGLITEYLEIMTILFGLPVKVGPNTSFSIDGVVNQQLTINRRGVEKLKLRGFKLGEFV